MKRLLQASGRWLLMGLVALVLRRAPASAPGPCVEPRLLRKVLLIRIDSRVGNVLLTTPLLRALREGMPWARVDFLVAGGNEALVEGLAANVLTFRKRDLFRAPWRFVRSLWTLRSERYDAVIEAGHWHTFSFTSAALARLTGAPIRVGHARGPTARFLTHEVRHDPTLVRDVTAKLELLGPLGLSARGEALETTVDGPMERRWADALVARLHDDSRVVSFNPGSRKVDHRWTARGFGALARALGEEGFLPLVLWGPGEEELAREVVSESGGVAVLAPRTRLAELAALFRASRVVVTNDTGPLHVAVATGAPVVATLVRPDGARWSHEGSLFRGLALEDDGPEAVARVMAAVLELEGLAERAELGEPEGRGFATSARSEA